jgi:hypothetical protein
VEPVGIKFSFRKRGHDVRLEERLRKEILCRDETGRRGGNWRLYNGTGIYPLSRQTRHKAPCGINAESVCLRCLAGARLLKPAKCFGKGDVCLRQKRWVGCDPTSQELWVKGSHF